MTNDPNLARYSGTPLVSKLGIKPGHLVFLISPPADFDHTLGALPDRAQVATSGAKSVDVVVFFVRSSAELIDGLAAATAALKSNGGLWIAWPKKSSGVKTDLHEQMLRDIVLPTGLVDNKVCAIDATWSGLRFVWRKELR